MFFNEILCISQIEECYGFNHFNLIFFFPLARKFVVPFGCAFMGNRLVKTYNVLFHNLIIYPGTAPVR